MRVFVLCSLALLAGSHAAEANSCEPYRAKFDQLNIGDHWTKISQLFGRPTSMEDTANGETVYVYDFADCALTFRAGSNNMLTAKQANPNPSFTKESTHASTPKPQVRYLSGELQDHPRSSRTGELSARIIANKTLQSVVAVTAVDRDGIPIALGSGFILQNDLVATNVHVLKGAQAAKVKPVNQQREYLVGGIRALDRDHDLAIIVVPGLRAGTGGLRIDGSKDFGVGDTVYAAGNPRGLEGTFSQGIVSAVRDDEKLIQITAPISPGSSGGPVVDNRGNVICVAVSSLTEGQNLNFCVPASYMQNLLSEAVTDAAAHRTEPLAQVFASSDSLTGRFPTSGKRDWEKGCAEQQPPGGAVAENLDWEWGGGYSFSVRNILGRPIADIYMLVIFYGFDCNPLDFQVIHYEGIIPASLAKRLRGTADRSVHTGSMWSKKLVHIRVLDFRMPD